MLIFYESVPNLEKVYTYHDGFVDSIIVRLLSSIKPLTISPLKKQLSDAQLQLLQCPFTSIVRSYT
jgi:hypothetical protein